jgi:uncharacterized protein YeaO (DUF488 family)
MIKLKRAYEKASPEDGKRILVERLWPRGMTKKRAAVDLWLKDIAPSPELRKWYSHDPTKWKQFAARYRKELEQKEDAVKALKKEARGHTVTLIFAAKDPDQSSALVLKKYLESR